jgi:nicotinamide-nucleotide amidase
MAEQHDQAAPPFEQQVGEWLRRRDLRLVTAESCTGGLLGDRLTNVPGSSEYYLGGFIAYANALKEQLLGVRPETLELHGAVSAETVLEMARGARQALRGAQPAERLVALSISGVAGPGGGTPEKPVGTVWVGMSAPGLERAWRLQLAGSRVEIKASSASQALGLLLDFLKGKVPA